MSDRGDSGNGELSKKEWDRVLNSWVGRGRSDDLQRWFDRQVDDEGAPIRLSIPEWERFLERLMEARRQRPGWPTSMDDRVRSLLRSVLRFSRSDGNLTTRFNGEVQAGSREKLAALARAFPGTAEAKVLGWWLSLPKIAQGPPPMPAWSSAKHPLAVLRASWRADEDLLVVDHRECGNITRLELVGSGHSWLGPEWTLAEPSAGPATPAKPHQWISNSAADLAEWSFRCGGRSITRTALLLRGRLMAILADEIGGKAPLQGPLETRLALPPGVIPASLRGCRGTLLRQARKRSSAQVLPLALPCLPYKTERGEFVADSDEGLTLRQTPNGRKCWLPWLISWDPERHRRKLSWRILTVSQRSRRCRPDEAFAVRVSWGRDDTIVIYRSLTPPARRAFLGHLTTARFLVGKFTAEGIVEPILSLEANT